MRGLREMNLKNALVVAVTVFLILGVAAFLFFRELLKESVSTHIPPAQKVAGKDPMAVYEIPQSAVPDVVRIETNMKRAAEQRKKSDEVIAKMRSDNAITREKIRSEAVTADKAAMMVVKSGNVDTSKVPARRISASPSSRETEEDIKAKGVMAY